MAMSKGKVSEKMQRAVRKLQSRIGNPNQQYQNLSSDEASPRSAGGSIRKRSSSLSHDTARDDLKSDDESPASPPSDVPEGFLAVYVGRERQRFVISANYLKHQMFKVLLEKSAEEYGFEHKGGLPIACDVAYFENLLWSIQSKNPGTFQEMSAEEIMSATYAGPSNVDDEADNCCRRWAHWQQLISCIRSVWDHLYDDGRLTNEVRSLAFC